MADFNTKLARLPCAYQRGAIVYHRLDKDGTAGMIYSVQFNLDGSVTYIVIWADELTSSSRHCEYEISSVPSFGAVAEGD